MPRIWIRRSICLAISFAVSASFLSDAIGQDVSRWIGTDGNWSDSSNWDNGVPIGFAIAVIESGGEIVQDIEGLVIVGVELNSDATNIVLHNSISIGEFLLWHDGKFSGTESVQMFGTAEINGGDLETMFENFGEVVFGTSGQFARLDSVKGGAWINRSGSTANALHGVLFGGFVTQAKGLVTIESGSSFTAEAGSLQSVWDVENAGVMNLQTLAFFFGDFVQSTDAQLFMQEGGADFFQVSDLDGLISGNGSILNLNGPFDVEFVPGGRKIGTFESSGLLMMTPDTVSNFQIGANLQSDLLSNQGGPFQLNGTLNIEALPGVTTGTYTLFTYNNAFMLDVDDIQLGDVPTGFVGELVHEPQMQRVVLVVDDIDPVVLGDINRDGLVDLLDINPFIELLSAGIFQVEADINCDGEVNLLDVSGFVELLTGI